MVAHEVLKQVIGYFDAGEMGGMTDGEPPERFRGPAR